MQLNALKPRTINYKSTVVGRGGKRGKTSGRGGKGQTARAGHKIRPESRDMIKKIPKRRGYGRNRSRGIRTERLTYTPVNISLLEEKFSAGETVSPSVLLARGLVRAVKGRAPKIKILGDGALAKALTVEHCAVSASAKAAIEKAGGTLHA